MYKIELLLSKDFNKDGEPVKIEYTRENPLLFEDCNFFTDEMKEEISNLITYEDLCDSKLKKNMLNMAYNGLSGDFMLKNKGIPYLGRVAMVAYDEYADFPVWIAVVDNRSGNLKYNYYDPCQQNDREKFSWAIRG